MSRIRSFNACGANAIEALGEHSVVREMDYTERKNLRNSAI